jgi:hypothetical protein
MHSDLERELQLAVGELLKLAWRNSGKQWEDFGREHLKDPHAEKSRTKTDRETGLVWPKTAITGTFAVILIDHCKASKGLIVPKPLQDRLGALWSPADAAEPTAGAADPAAGAANPAGSGPKKKDDERAFILALELGTDGAGKSIEQFKGPYLHFALSDKGMIVTTKCTLQEKRDRDSAPVYDTSRWYNEFGEVPSKGVYFAGEKNLYLLSSPKGRLDVRLSVFSVMWPGRKQEVVRGFALAVNPQSTIVATRAVLLRAEYLDPMVADELWREPASVTSFGNIGNFVEVEGRRLPDNQFKEIGEYLTGAEAGDPIGLMTLLAPGF